MKKSLFCLLALVLAAGTVRAGDNAISITSGEGGDGDTVTLAVNMDAVDTIAGWSWGVLHDSAALTLVAGSVVDGSTTLTVNNGNPPDFNQINDLGVGWTVGVVISFLGSASLAPGAGYEMNTADYTITGLAEGETSDVCFDNGLGSPPVATVVVVAGQSETPIQTCGTVTRTAAPPTMPFEFAANGSSDVNIAASSTSASFSILDLDAAPRLTQGFSMGVGHDGAVLAATGVVALGDLAAVNGGSGPDFFGENLLADGFTIGVVYAFLGGEFIEFGAAQDVVETSYDIVGAVADGDTTALTWTDALGSPPVANVVVVDGQSVDADFVDGSINFVATPAVGPFVRGDANQDLIVNIADGIFIIGTQFYGYSAQCNAASDANNDGFADISDAMFVISYRFMDGPAPSFPFPDCDTSDADADVALGCDNPSCP